MRRVVLPFIFGIKEMTNLTNRSNRTEHGEPFTKQVEDELMMRRTLSRRKLLTSIGIIGAGAYWATIGAKETDAASVTESTYAASLVPPPFRSGSWIDITQPPYNARPGGSFDNSAIFQKAVDNAPADGGTIYVPAGDYLVESGFTINKDCITFAGTGKLMLGRDILLVASRFRCSGLRFKALNNGNNIRGFLADSAVAGKTIERITVENCEFEDCFYATHFRGTSQNPVKDIFVTNCKSTAPVGRNAGHFQNVYTYNTYYSGNACYNGQNATSYNFINGNGKIKIIGNYDFNNLYGSCEIENSPGAEVIISSNNFDKQLWIDDSSRVVIDGNIIKERIFVTVQDNDCEHVIISNNITDRIYVDKFSTYRAGKVKNLEICHNEITGPGTWGIFIRGTYAEACRIVDNRIAPGLSNGSIGIVRDPGLDLVISGNEVNGRILFSSSGGTVRVYENRNYTLSGTHDTPALERLFQSAGNSLNVVDVKFVLSQTVRVEAGSAGSVFFALDPVATGSGKMVKLTYTACVQNSAPVFDAAEQNIIIANVSGSASISAGALLKTLGNAATAFSIDFQMNPALTELHVAITNPGAVPLSVSISCMEHAAIHLPA